MSNLRQPDSPRPRVQFIVIWALAVVGEVVVLLRAPAFFKAFRRTPQSALANDYGPFDSINRAIRTL
jgi:hypothetical protein